MRGHQRPAIVDGTSLACQTIITSILGTRTRALQVSPMQDTISGLVASYGYVVLFFLVGLESLGIPLPGETVLVTAAAFAALGHLSIYAVVATAAAAAIIGDNGGYWVGRSGGIA